MKRTIFLPILCLAAFLALFTVISCDRTDPVGLSEDKYYLPDDWLDENQFTINGYTIRQGQAYDLTELKSKVPGFYESMKFDEIQNNPNKRAITVRRVTATAFKDCTCDAEYCPQLGRELFGKKSGSFTQVASTPIGLPWYSLLYNFDPENLTNNGNYHDFYDQSWNGDNNLFFSLWIVDGGVGYTIDIDGPYHTSYNVRHYFKSYHEGVTLSPPYSSDESANIYMYSTCGSCDSCDD